MSRLARGLAAAAVAVLVGAALPRAAAGAGAPDRPAREEAGLALADQTTAVDPGGTVAVAVLADGVPGAASVRISLHDRARSRSELAGAATGSGLRGVLRTRTAALEVLPQAADGSRSAVLPLAGDPGSTVEEPGVYPVEVEVLDGSGAVLDELVTEVVVRPPASDSAPPLAVAPVALVGTDRTHLPDAAEVHALADALAGAPAIPVTVAAGPALLEDLAASDDPAGPAAVAALATAAADRPVLALPYVPTSPDALAAAGIADELPRHLDRGAAVLQAQLGQAPSQRTWLAAPDLGASGLRLLSALGVRAALVSPGEVERVRGGVLSVARPFELSPPRDAGRRTAPDPPVDALLVDTTVDDTVHAGGDPILLSARVLADLAMLWFEQPGVERAVVLPLDPTVDPVAVGRVLAGLQAPSLFRPVPLDDAIAGTPHLEDGRGSTLRRRLDPERSSPISSATAEAIKALRSTRASLAGMLGPDSPGLDALDRHLLRATGIDLDTAGRRREVTRAREAAAAVETAISTPETMSITLTARTGTVPLTIRNDTGGPVDVLLRFRSPKVELPEGSTRRVTLAAATTRLDIEVRLLSSGAFPFEVDVVSPDGALTLSTTRYSVRSTAVSGVGLVLSIGAVLFLVVWWARHWRAARSSKLVEDTSGPA